MRSLLLLISLVSLSATAQINLDSLWSIWNDPSRPDTMRLKAMKQISWDHFVFVQPDSAFELAQLHYEFAERIGNKKQMATALNTQGVSYAVRGMNSEAVQYLSKATAIFEELGDKHVVAATLSNIGNIYSNQGDYAHAIDYYSRGLKYFEQVGDKKRTASSLGNIGVIYHHQGNLTKALEHYEQALESSEEVGDKKGVALFLSNIGVIHNSEGNQTQAVEYHSRALKIREEIEDKGGIAASLNNLGSIYADQGEYAKAAKQYSRALKLTEEIQDNQAISTTLNNMGSLAFRQGDYTEALKYGSMALDKAREAGAAVQIKNASKSLWRVNKKLGNQKSALDMYKLHIAVRDSIESEENQKETIRQEYKYEYEKQATADSIRAAEAAKVKDAEIAKQNAEIEAKEKEQVMLYGGLGLVIVFSIFIFNRFRVTKKQKKVIEEQRDLVEGKNKEILDSINYAKRLQDAILPAPKVVKEYLAESFILYKPKDIVAGDFYWLETPSKSIDFDPPEGGLNQDDRPPLGGPSQRDEGAEGWTYIAAADCTGHGVPGAMVSVVCSNALSKALIEEGVTDTGKLLDRTRELVIERFGKSDSEIKDGMDISLAAIRHDGRQVRWSGANNPLWVLRNNDGPALRQAQGDPHSELRTQNSELLHEVKADKQPIGAYETSKPFTQHTIDLQEGDILYMFSDGYPDQFGGPKGKKFKPANFKKLLLSIQDEPMDRQRELIDSAFEEWRGELEQIDDVCVIGVRV